jgi:hypothetical protein
MVNGSRRPSDYHHRAVVTPVEIGRLTIEDDPGQDVSGPPDMRSPEQTGLARTAEPPPPVVPGPGPADAVVPPHADGRIAGVARYWAGLAADGRLPGRADIDPVDIPRLLRNVFLVDVRAGVPRYVFRLVGTGVVDLLGELTGRPVGTGLDAEEAERVLSHYDRCARDGRPMWREGVLRTRRNRHAGFQRVLLPLAADGRRVDMVLGAIVGFDWDGAPL